MNRRKFIELNGWLFGLAFTAGSSGLIMSSCRNETKTTQESKLLLGEKEAEFLNELAEIIIPTTDTPGGKEANPGQYIVLIHNHCLNEEEQAINKDHLSTLINLLNLEEGNEITSFKKAETFDIITKLDSERNESFRLYKNLIVSAFLSSEVGASKFLKFSLVPGRYDGCSSERPW